MQRDKEVTTQLQDAGWIVIRFWEWQIKKHLDECVGVVVKTIAEVSSSSYDEADLLSGGL